MSGKNLIAILTLLLGTSLAAQASEGNFTKDPTCPGGFYFYGPSAGTGINLYYSNDFGHGITFLAAGGTSAGSLIADPVPGYLIKHVDPGIFLSTNWGFGWQWTGTAPSEITAGRYPGEIYTFAWIGRIEVLKYSLNYGSTWEIHYPQGLIGMQYMYYAPSIGNVAGELYVLQVDSGWIYRSTNYGDSFTYMSTIPINDQTDMQLCRGALPGEIYYFNNHTGNLYFSPNSGLHFDSVYTLYTSPEYGRQMQGGTRTGEVFLFTSRIYIWGGGEAYIYYSTDYGYNYTIYHSFSSTAAIPVVSLAPLGTTTFPPGGGTLNYRLEGHNNSTIPCTVDVWCDITLPNGNPYGPVMGPVLNFPMGSLWSGERDRTLFIPANAPAGTYTLHAYVGDYSPINPTILDQDQFQFSKTGMAAFEPFTGFVDTGESFQCDPIGGERTSALQTDLLAPEICPNPFNPMTAISYKLQVASRVNLRVYDTAGRLVATLIEGWREAGDQETSFDGYGLPSGVYIYRLTVGEHSASGKMILMK